MDPSSEADSSSSCAYYTSYSSSKRSSVSSISSSCSSSPSEISARLPSFFLRLGQFLLKWSLLPHVKHFFSLYPPLGSFVTLAFVVRAGRRLLVDLKLVWRREAACTASSSTKKFVTTRCGSSWRSERECRNLYIICCSVIPVRRDACLMMSPYWLMS